MIRRRYAFDYGTVVAPNLKKAKAMSLRPWLSGMRRVFVMIFFHIF